jgi:hypothetical protein
MSTSIAEVIEALRARGTIAADAAPPDMPDEHRPWYVLALTGVAGWLAGLFLLGFLGIAFKLESKSVLGFLGAGLLGAAWALYYADRRAVFLEQLALALSFAGQAALAWSFIADTNSGLVICITLLVLQLGVLLVIPNKTARSIAALFAVIAWVYVLRFALKPARGEEIFFAEGFDAARVGRVAAMLMWLVTWVPMVAGTLWLVTREGQWMAGPLRIFLRPILVGLLLALSLGGIASEPFMIVAFGMDEIGKNLSIWALFPLLSIALALFSAYCAFRLRSDGLAAFAVFAALMHLARFYYLYGTSLTWKALIMACLGVLLLGAGTWLARREATP